MAGRDYYVILGISRDASPAGIRSAYREKAMTLHPDHAGRQSESAFRELTEAYETLSDPVRRNAYNSTLASAKSRSFRQPEPEMLVPEPVSILGNSQGVHPSFDALLERILRNFTGLGVPKYEAAEALNFEVILSTEEAARGGIIPLGIPVFVDCPDCSGSGYLWPFPCWRCDARGTLEEERIISARIPPMVRHGSVFEYSLREFGYSNLYLCLHVIING